MVALVAVLGSTFSQAAIEIAFYAQRGYITQTKCVNRDKPWLKCDGKCYLKKQLEQDQQNNHKENIQAKFEMVWLNDAPVIATFEPSVTTFGFNNHQQTLISDGHVRCVYRPPVGATALS